MRKKLFLLSFVLMFGLASSASAAETWDGSSTQLWTDAASWGGTVPGAGTSGYIEAGVPACIIDYTMDIDIGKLAVGYQVAGDAYLYMYGGNVDVDDRVYVGGEKGDKSSNGNFTMHAGTIQHTASSGERKFYIGYKGPDDEGYFTMNGGTVSNFGKFYIAGEKPDSYGEMEMNGGSVSMESRLRVGGKGGIGKLYMNGGTIHSADDLNVNDEDDSALNGGAGYIYMTGGTITVDDDLKLNSDCYSDSVAEIYLHGGEIEVGGEVLFNPDIVETPASTLIDITYGTLTLAGDVVSDVLNDFVANGFITAYGGTGQVLATYWSAEDKTVVNAIVPEPATIALLGFGGLALLRRRK